MKKYLTFNVSRKHSRDICHFLTWSIKIIAFSLSSETKPYSLVAKQELIILSNGLSRDFQNPLIKSINTYLCEKEIIFFCNFRMAECFWREKRGSQNRFISGGQTLLRLMGRCQLKSESEYGNDGKLLFF